MYIILAILAFGLIIAIHELGHFLTAKAMNVKVIEFSIGMGPKILSKQGKETLYSLRLIPFGGYCSMEGEYGEKLERGGKEKDDKDGNDIKSSKIAFTDYLLADGVSIDPEEFQRAQPERFPPEPETQDANEEPGADPRSFNAQKRWKRIVILAAGSVFNIVAAFIIMLILSFGAEGYISTTLAGVSDRLPGEGPSEIRQGDIIYAVNGERLYYYNDYALFMNLNANKPVVMTLLRDGEKVEYSRRTYNVDGNDVYRYTIDFQVIEPSLWENLKYSAYQTFNFIRLIRVSIAMMIGGEASVTEVAGPVGIISTINDVGQQSPNIGEAIVNIVYFTAFIGVNVAVINLLPIPAMDGGRILFVFLTFALEKLIRRKIDPKYENYINTAAFVLLLGLTVLIMYNDIMKLIG